MSKFKVGARVTCVDPGTYDFLTEGKTYVIIPDDRNSLFGGISALHTVCIVGDKGASVTLNWWRFEAKKEGFNISTATDQELADEYRRLVIEAYACVRELHNRGFIIATGSGTTIKQTDQTRKIYKSTKVEL